MNSKLCCEIVQRIECMAGIKSFLILTVTALDLAIVPRSVGTNQFVPDAKLRSRLFKQCRQITLTVGKTVGKLKSVVRLDTLYLNSTACIPRRQLAEKVR